MSEEKGAKTLETLVEMPQTSIVGENLLSSTTATVVVDIEKPKLVGQTKPGTPVFDKGNNHFFEEKLKKRAPPGINGSLVFLYAIFFGEFTIGWINLNSCPLNILIPIFLIVSGFLGAVSKALSRIENKYAFWATGILLSFNVLWHALGTYEVYKEYQPNYDPDPKNNTVLYCNRTVYLMAFWILNFEYTLLSFFILLSTCYLLMRNSFKPLPNDS